MNTPVSKNNRIEQVRQLRWVPIGLMLVAPRAQRTLRQHWVDHIAADLDLERIGTPTVNKRDGHYFICDGQHRILALRQTGWGDQQIQCWVYDGLSADAEGELFLQHNEDLQVAVFEKFRVGTNCGRPIPTAITAIVQAQGCAVSQNGTEGAVSCVATLTKIYNRAGEKVLGRTIKIAYAAYGTPGLQANCLDGLALLCARYNGELEDQLAIAKLANIGRGVDGLLQKGEIVRRQTGVARNQAVAAAAVDVINTGRGGKKLTPWFREDVA